MGTLTQQLDRPRPLHVHGRGKDRGTQGAIADEDATLVIFDDELSPAQGKNIEDLNSAGA
jgi:GTPase